LPTSEYFITVNNKNNVSIVAVESQLLHFLKTNIIDKSVAADENTLFQSLKIDSLSTVEMILFLERKYQVTIPENELIPDNFKSVKTLAACAIRCLQNE
jgi:acyl carrier protein